MSIYKLRQSKRGNTLFMVIVVLLFGMQLQVAAGQNQYRRVIKQDERNEPLEITDVKVNGQPISIGQGFSGGEDWLRGLTIHLKNTSDKPISLIRVVLFINDAPGGYSGGQIALYKGYVPSTPSKSLEPQIKTTPIAQNESVELVVSDEVYARNKEHLLNTNPSFTFNSVRILLDKVIFADGSGWSKGMQHYRDPNDPRKWIPVNSPPTPAKSFFRRGDSAITPAVALWDGKQSNFLRPLKSRKIGMVRNAAPVQAYTCVQYYGYYLTNCSQYDGCGSPCVNFTDLVGGFGSYNGYLVGYSCFSYSCAVGCLFDPYQVIQASETNCA